MSLLLVRPLTPPHMYMHTLSQLDTAIKLKGLVNSDCQLPNRFTYTQSIIAFSLPSSSHPGILPC